VSETDDIDRELGLFEAERMGIASLQDYLHKPDNAVKIHQ